MRFMWLIVAARFRLVPMSHGTSGGSNMAGGCVWQTCGGGIRFEEVDWRGKEREKFATESSQASSHVVDWTWERAYYPAWPRLRAAESVRRGESGACGTKAGAR